MSSHQEKLDLFTKPIFSEDAGQRMRLIRMKMLMDQAALAHLLQCGQQMISEIERGRVKDVPFNMARFKAIFGKWWSWILLGTGGAPPSGAYIRTAYWEHKLKKRRKPGSGQHKVEESGRKAEAARRPRPERKLRSDYESYVNLVRLNAGLPEKPDKKPE